MQRKFLTFKQFIIEGGSATAEHNTTPFGNTELIVLCRTLSEWFNLSEDDTKNRIVGSGAKLLSTKSGTCGDLDFVVTNDELSSFLEVLKRKTAVPVRKIGNSTYCFVVPVADKKIQLDILCVASIEWGKFAMYSDPSSQYKSGARNELIHAIVKNCMKAGEDLTLNDSNGRVIGYTRNTFNLNNGFGRIYKLADEKKAGGYTSELKTVDFDTFIKFMKTHGVQNKISNNISKCISPDDFVNTICQGSSVTDFNSVESLVKLINTKFPTKKNKIFSDARAGCIKRKFDVPQEIK